MYLKKTSFLLMSLIVFLLNTSCNDDNGENNDGTFTYMSVDLNGNQYNGLKTAGFGLNPAAMVQTSNFGHKYLLLQGNHPDFQINIKIHENNWGVTGTFTLIEGFSFSEESSQITYIDSNSNFDFDIEGELTLTNFDLTNNLLEGTFNFSSTSNIATGTLNYPLDDPEFQ